jgi:hypothetical protein
VEFEIDDDPQGLPEWLDGERDGGLKEDLLVRRGRRPAFRPRQFDEAREDIAPLQQLGEAA